MDLQQEKGHKKIKLIECPRDAMQGWKNFIPTEKKIAYINSLLRVGFDVLDFGSLVSPKAIPQMADTKDVVDKIDLAGSKTKLLAIVANVRGAQDAAAYHQIDYIGFPFSVSETFQQRNANSSIKESLARVNEIHEICIKHEKELVIYLSMAFGNPYGDPYSEKIVFEWADIIARMNIKIISLADTVGLATPGQVFSLTDYLVKKLPGYEIGVHLHSAPLNRKPKIDAALRAGCYRFDGALKGIGGCPMANDELIGNMDTELMIQYFDEMHLLQPLDKKALQESVRLAGEIFI